MDKDKDLPTRELKRSSDEMENSIEEEHKNNDDMKEAATTISNADDDMDDTEDVSSGPAQKRPRLSHQITQEESTKDLEMDNASNCVVSEGGSDGDDMDVDSNSDQSNNTVIMPTIHPLPLDITKENENNIPVTSQEIYPIRIETKPLPVDVVQPLEVKQVLNDVSRVDYSVKISPPKGEEVEQTIISPSKNTSIADVIPDAEVVDSVQVYYTETANENDQKITNEDTEQIIEETPSQLDHNEQVLKKSFLKKLPKRNFVEIFLFLVVSIELFIFAHYASSYIAKQSSPTSFYQRFESANTNDRQFNSPLIPPPSLPDAPLVNLTLRQYLTHPDGFHLGMAPAFFGFYAYFGALITFDEELHLLPLSQNSTNLLKSVAGASAGAMAASLIATGLSPRHAAEYVSTFDLVSFADPPGFMGILKGEKFEKILREYIDEQQRMPSKVDGSGAKSFQLEDALIPVAVTGFDLMSMKGKIISKGDMAQATRASATFPGLFQPVFVWDDDSIFPSSALIDGGVEDPFGVNGLFGLGDDDVSNGENKSPKRIVNLSVGSLTLNPKNSPPGPSDLQLKTTDKIESVVSISVLNTPKCGPWAMENGPLAAEAGRKAMNAVLDLPMYQGKEKGHYIVNVDFSLL